MSDNTRRLLINAAMIPAGQSGLWRYHVISRQDAIAWLRHYAATATSYIGYMDNVALINRLAGVQVEMSRQVAHFGVGDEALVMRLKYRVRDPGRKGKFVPNPEDFEWGLLVYEEAE